MRVTYVQIYCERIMDLMAMADGDTSSHLRVRGHDGGDNFIEGTPCGDGVGGGRVW